MLGLLAGSSDTVMAAQASRADSEVIEGRGQPGERAVAGTAVLTGQDVPRRPARPDHTVVAARAFRGDALMIESRRHPSERRVTVLAGAVARDMAGSLSGGQDAVMAADAVGGDAEVGQLRTTPFARCAGAAHRSECACAGARRRLRAGVASGGRWADHGTDRRAGRRRSGGCFSLRRTAAPVVRTMAALAILTHVMAARPRCQIGDTVETQSRQVMALIAGAAGHRQHDGMLRRCHRSAAE